MEIIIRLHWLGLGSLVYIGADLRGKQQAATYITHPFLLLGPSWSVVGAPEDEGLEVVGPGGEVDWSPVW